MYCSFNSKWPRLADRCRLTPNTKQPECQRIENLFELPTFQRRSIFVCAPQDQHWTFRVAKNSLGDGAEQNAAQAVVPVRRHDDQFGTGL
ncbi:MAG: hypothetical protein ACI93T_003794, partial [Porticoccaceae bacterium]